MRTPVYEDLSKEQDAICVRAPLDGVTLVSGAPGTGKTVVAFYRAEVAAKKGQTPRLVMFNSVLHRYSSNASENEKVRSGMNTWHSWLGTWWKKAFKCYFPQVERYCPDWDQMITSVFGLAGDTTARQRALRGWGHLIIDEGQDFAVEFYRTAHIMLNYGKAADEKGAALTVLADENQRLHPDRNSSLMEIVDALAIPPTRHYRLTRNYRNTYEIARAAAHFYCGLQSGIPDLPEGRHGNTPRMIRVRDLNSSVEAIRRFVVNQGDLEIGVFLPNRKLQTKYFNKLLYRLTDVDGIKVQRYTSGDKEHGDAEKMDFDRPGTVTVLCDSSCKGLEFDAVFIPELQARRWDPAAVDHMRMQLYVLSSRARHHLTCLYSVSQEDEVPLLKQFPDPESGLWEWIDG